MATNLEKMEAAGRLSPEARRWLLAAGAAALCLLAGAVLALLFPGLTARPGRSVLRDTVLVLVALCALVPALAALAPHRAARWLEPATAEGLGAMRGWIAAILLANVLWEDLPSSAYLPRGMLDLDRHWLVGLLHGLPIGFDAFLASPAALRVYESATALLLALALVGLFTRWTVPAAALAYLLFASIFRAYSWSYHMGLVPLYALLLLALTPCGDAFSLDRRLRARRGLPVPPAREPTLRYGAARLLVWTGIALPYGMAGLSKLRNTGLSWWHGEHMKQMLVSTVVEPMHFDFQVTIGLLQAPGWVFGVLGLAALLGEVTFPLVLVSRLARKVLPLLTAGMHVGILLMQNILFPDLIAIQAVFYDWRPLRRRLAGWLPGARGAEAAAPGPVPATAPARHSVRSFVPQTRAMQAFLAVAFLAWATRTEKFPLSAMQMFSRPSPPEPVQFVRPLVRYEDGRVEPARFERWIGAMADTRYRWLLRDWGRHPERIALLREFLDACARRANASPGPRVQGFVLEVRRWDFRRRPGDPGRGELVAVLRHDVAPPAP
ncbi:MAG TPA: hypothetical protein VF746_08380 [Longimicrobium sp.]|jgi:hypothetical protein